MTQVAQITIEVPDSDIMSAIQAALARQRDGASVVELWRRRWEYATSAALELVTALADDGSERHYVLKHLSLRSVSESARRAKPAFLIDPRREIEVYRRLLAPLDVGPRVIGFRISPETEVYWLLTEYVTGRRLFEVGERDRWIEVGGWLANVHDRLAAADSQVLRRDTHLIAYDRDWYTIWPQRALRFFASQDPLPSRHSRTALRWLADRYEKVVERLTALPATIIHGEFYPANVLVENVASRPFVCPVDWEMASVGPRIMDLAALTSGQWKDQDRRAVIAAYVAESRGDARATLEDVLESVQYAHIHLAMQWLGWFGRRAAHADHAYDWLADAIDRAEALEL